MPKTPHLADLGDRVWYALHCLERDEFGAPPKDALFEKPNGPIARGLIGKLVSGKRLSVRDPTLRVIARALRQPAGFFLDENPALPPLSGPLPPRPKKYDSTGEPISLPGIIEDATSVALVRLGIVQHEIDYLGATGEHEMDSLPEAGRAAALATVYLEGCSVEEAFAAALAAYKEHGDELGKMPEGWLKPMRDHLPKRSKSSVRRIPVARAK